MNTLEKEQVNEKPIKLFSHILKVRWVDLDENGHVNNGIYQSYFDEARRAAFEDAGFDMNDLRKRQVGPVILRAELDYKAELKYPENVKLTTRFEPHKGSRVLVVQDLYRESDGALVCSAKFHGLFMDFSRMRPYKVTDEEVSRLA
ncbi:acyl-CoA thioesterase [Leptospira sp. 201903071]|uniref:acyl-CoA thioesterase n=1 Tax=Leptospira ainazelensis TaxID=2810034 RepID=UPI0019644AEC|nr:acyl-CoA thioesterase [Leptospira ainazelensis]MBM9500383.1 acyl-CoA thioesterase [Leptospira ainazelensis]